MAFRRTRGILSGSTDSGRDADCIVTAMILGLCREYVGRKREFIFSFVPDAGERNQNELQNVVDKINAALETLGIANLPPVKIKALREWQEQEYITGRSRGTGLPFSMLRKHEPVATGAMEIVANQESDPRCAFGYIGRGAYTGVHALSADNIRYRGSTFRHYIEPDMGDRWVPAHGGETWGRITGRPTLDGMHDAPSAGGNTELVGYTHGMIQAVYSAAYDGFKGDTIEVAVGVETTKLASCFACTTFMCASDRPPDAIHLGRGESWAPIYSRSPSCGVLLGRRRQDARTEPEKLRDAVDYVNEKWHKRCASWLFWGTTVDIARIRRSHRESWRKLKELALASKSEIGPSASLFLDALTVHDTDANRVNRTLA